MKNVAKTKKQLIEELEARQRRVAELEKLETERKWVEEELAKRVRIIDTVTDAVITTDLSGNITSYNTGAELIYGYKAQEVIGKPVSMFYLAEDTSLMESQISDIAKGNTISAIEARIIGKKEKEVPVILSLAPVRDLEGKIVGLVGIAKDITERKQAEERIKHITLVLRAIRSVNQLITKEKECNRLLQGVCDNLIKTRGYHNAWVALLGESGRLIMSAEAGLGKDFLSMKERLKRGELTDCSRRALKQSKVVVIEDPSSTCSDCPLVKKYHGRGAMTARLEYEGKVYGLLAVSIPPNFIGDKEEQGLFREVAQDIAFALHNIEMEDEHKRAEEALRESEERYRGLISNVKLGIFRSMPGPAGRFFEVNPAIEEITGYSREELLEMNVSDLYVYPEEREMVLKEAASSTGKAAREILFMKKDGSQIIVSDIVVAVRDSAGKVIYFDGILEDITERKQIEENIKQAAKEWRTTFDSITDLVSIHNRDFKLTRVNKAFADTFKMKPKELIGKTCYEVVHRANEPVPNCPHKKTLDTKRPYTAGFFEPSLGIHLEVTTSPIFDEKGEVIACVHVARDITERKKMDEQLIVTDRLASVGELASGIAHELNNPLTSVIGFSQLLLGKDVPDEVKEDIEVIYREAQRTAEVVKNMLTFARKHAPVKQQVDINSIIDKVLELRAYEQRVSNIQVKTRFAPDLPEVMADYFQLQQVFLNIIINAEHFMIEAHNRGTLTITTKRTGSVVKACFADDGPGISKENLGHLFDPFFTTKEVGKGTGLGLSICHGIISEHGGRIYVESKLSKGATFIVELPISDH